MAWLRARLEVPARGVTAIEALLEALGAVAVSLEDARDQPLLEPDPGSMPIWAHVVVSGLFPADAELPGRIEAARTLWLEQAGFALPEILLEPLADADWSRAWLQHARSLTFAGRLHIRPVADDEVAPAVDGGATVDLAPGLAFGTGSHPTTRMCLERLAAEPPAGGLVLDFGCGSGILALAALALGAQRVLAIDHDPQAVQAAAENARRNRMAGRMTFASKLDPMSRCDVLLANVLAGPLIELAPQLCAAVTRGGRVMLSGILAEQAEAVCAAWPEVGFVVHESEGWVCLDGRKLS